MIERLPSIVGRLTASSLANPWKYLGAGLALALAGGLLASRLEIRSSFAELLPSDVPSVQLVNELIRRVGGDGTVLVMVEAIDGEKDLPRAEAMAKVLANDYLALGSDVIRSVEWSMKPIEAWFADHWPMFAPLKDLEKARDSIREEKARAKQHVLDLGLEDEAPEPSSSRRASMPTRPAQKSRIPARSAC